jgi:hypothetical protein
MGMFTAKQLVEAGFRTMDWAANLLNENGTFDGIENSIRAYYKAPMAFAVSGRVGEATAITNHLKKTFFNKGDFHGARGDPTSDGHKNYRNAWIGRGLHILGFYDLSVPTGDFLESEMDDTYGGVLTDSAIIGGEREMDWGATCSTNLALMTMGRMDAAVRCGDYLVDMLREQSNNENILYLRRAGDGQVIHDLTGRPATDYSIKLGATGQVYWYLGMSLVVFAGLYRATGDAKWRDAADKIFSHVSKCDDEVYATITNGKVAWGAGAMFAATGDAKFGRLSDMIWTWVFETQTPEGLWIRKTRLSNVRFICSSWPRLWRAGITKIVNFVIAHLEAYWSELPKDLLRKSNFSQSGHRVPPGSH